MARVTTEDCLGNVQNEFELVLVAAKRARQLLLAGHSNIEETYKEEKGKSTVHALHEIAKNAINVAEVLDDVNVAPKFTKI